MSSTKSFFHDKLVLLLVSANFFLTILGTILILLRINNGQQPNYHIIQYRSNLGLSAFKNGTSASIDAFIFFIWMIMVINIVLSYRTYPLKRHFAIVLLGMSLLLIVLAMIVSNSLLVLP